MDEETLRVQEKLVRQLETIWKPWSHLGPRAGGKREKVELLTTRSQHYK